jgi:O-antigen/teichoic acid export membrane protein
MSQHLAKNTAFMTAASVGQKIIAFVYFLLLARIMMPERTGMFFLVTSIITMFSVVADLGLSSVLIRDIAKRPAEIRSIMREAIGLKYLLLIVAIITVFAASILFGYDALTTKLIWAAVLILISDALALVCYGVLRGSQQLKYEAVGMVIGQLVTVLTGTLSLLFFPNVIWLIVALIFGSFTNLAIASSQVIRLYGYQIFVPVWNKHQIMTLIKIMTPFALAGIFTKIYSTIDVILISKLMSTAAVGVYSVAYKFTYAFQFLPLAFSAALYPSLSAAIAEDRDTTKNTFSRAIWYILLIATPIVFGLWLVAPEAVNLVGKGYTGSVDILRVLIFVLFPSFLEIPFGALLNASDRQSSRMKILGVTMLCNIVLDLVFIPRFGLMGAVIGSLVSYSIMIILELFVVSRFLPTLLDWLFFKTVLRIVSSGIVMWVVGYFVKPIVGWIFIIPCAAGVYVACLLLTHSVTKKDLQGIRSLFRKTLPVV